MRIVAFSVMLILASVACSQDPRIDEIVEDLEQLSVRVEALAGEFEQVAKPAYWPTFADYELAMYIESFRLIRMYGRWSSVNREGFMTGWMPPAPNDYEDFEQVAVVYAASECVAGTELSSKEFSSFVQQRLFTLSAGDKGIKATAEKVVTDLIDGDRLNKNRIVAGVPVEERACERRYLYPKTGADASLAITLLAAASDIPGLNKGNNKQIAYKWFNSEAGAGDSTYLQFICEEFAKSVTYPSQARDWCWNP